MQHHGRNTTSLLFIFLLVSVGLACNLGQHLHSHFPNDEFKKQFCPADVSHWPATKRALCGVGIYLNRDSALQLEYLPNIGAKRAESITTFRAEHGPFKHLDDLNQIRGIGPSTIEKLAPWIEDVKSDIPWKNAQIK